MRAVAPSTTAPSAVERLAASRERLRQALQPAAGDRSTSQKASSGESGEWLASLMAVPGAAVVIESVQAWWTQHPLRATALVATGAFKAVVGPTLKKHPIGFVLGAVVIGGAIVWLRPWRGILKPALLAGLMPQLISKAFAHVPADTWLTVLSAMAARAAPPAAKTPAAPASAQASTPSSTSTSAPDSPATPAAPHGDAAPGSQTMH